MSPTLTPIPHAADAAAAVAHERERQHALVQVLIAQRVQPQNLAQWVAGAPHHIDAAVKAYRRNGHAHAERALAHACPTVQTLMGVPNFAALARTLWVQHPPAAGDLDTWGDELPGLIECSPSLTPWPFLADVARLDLLCRRAERATDRSFDAESLQALADTAPDGLFPRWAAGAGLLDSAYPVATLRHVHQVRQAHEGCAASISPTPSASEDRTADAVAAALRHGHAELVWVWRPGWQAQHWVIPERDRSWWLALACGQSVGQALAQADPHFEFETWLAQSLSQGWLTGFGLQADPVVDPRLALNCTTETAV